MNPIRRTLVAATCLLWPLLGWAHGGEVHDEAQPAAAVPVAPGGPRTQAVSPLFEVVAAFDGRTLVLHVDDYNTNAPVTAATVEVDGRSVRGKASETAPGVYALAAPGLTTPGLHALALTIEAGEAADLLSATLSVPKPAAGVEPTAAADAARWPAYAGWAAWAGAIVLAGGLLLGGRRRAQRRRQAGAVA